MSARFSPPVPAACAGIDVSAKRLDVCLLSAAGELRWRQSVANTSAGIRRLLKCLPLTPELRVCLEPTSRYHERLCAMLAAAGCPPRLADPRQLRDFARSLGQRAKTDRADALVLARLAACLPPSAVTPPPAEQQQLRLLVDRINALTRMGVQEKARLKLIEQCGAPACVRRDVRSHLALLERRGETLQQQALALLATQPQLARRYALLLTVSGVAQKSGLKLLALLSRVPPQLTKRQLVAYAGLDPQPRESGGGSKPRHISRRGNPELRAALLMPALVAVRCCPPLKEYYQRLLARGKKPMQALTAVMAKLLHIIWVMWQTDHPFDPSRIGTNIA